MDSELLGMIRVGGRPVRFYEPARRPDLAWVSVVDLMAAAGYPPSLVSAEYRRLFVPDERSIRGADGEETTVVPHIVALAIAGAAERHLGKPSFSAEYNAANVEATKLMALGMTDAQWSSFCIDALEFNALRYGHINGEIKPVGKIRRFLNSIARIGRRSGG